MAKRSTEPWNAGVSAGCRGCGKHSAAGRDYRTARSERTRRYTQGWFRMYGSVLRQARSQTVSMSSSLAAGYRPDECPGKAGTPGAETGGSCSAHVAVTVGFEPTVACTTLAFEASSFGRSDTSPPMSVSQPGPADKFAGRSQPTTTSKVPTRSAIPAARSSIIPASWSRFRQLSGIPLRPYSAPASCP